MNFLFVVLGLALLVVGGNWLLKASVGFSLRLNISKLVIGMTVVSFATSAPELIVSINSALQGSANLAVANVVGSNIANLGLVLGVTILFGTISVSKSFYITDWPIMMASSILLFLFIYSDGVLQRWQGLLLLISLLLYLVYMLKFNKTKELEEDLDEINQNKPQPLYKSIILLFLGGIFLWAGSDLLIEGAIGLAKYFNVSDSVIGLTVVSVGTSVPELAASIIAIIKKEKAISLGNLIGSNIFNILAVLGISSMIIPIKVTDASLISSKIYWMIAIAFIVLPLVFIPKKMKLGWKEGTILLALYSIFIFTTIYTS